MSKEHVWADWLGEILPGSGPYTVTNVSDDPAVVEQGWMALDLKLTVKRFCRSCNNGWMSQLENGTKPLLRDMIQGRPVVISPADQEQLAVWSFKTTLVLALTNQSSRRYFGSDDYPAFWKDRIPPPGTHLWLAAYQPEPLPGGQAFVAWYRNRLLSVTRPSRAESRDGHVMIMAIGRLVVMEFSSRWSDGSFRFTMPDRFARFLNPLWPGSGTARTWPPPEALLVDHLRTLVDLMSGGPPAAGS